MFAGVDSMKIIGQNPETPGAFGEYLLLDETLMKVVLVRPPQRDILPRIERAGDVSAPQRG